MEEKIKEILVKNALTSVPEKEITLETDLATLGFNSIIFIKLIIVLEEEFQIEFEAEELDFSKVRNLDDVIHYITKKIHNNEVH